MDNPVVYIFLNKGLHMSVGKASAQAGHAAIVSVGSIAGWKASPHRTMIVLEARDEAHMRSIQDYVQERGYDLNVVVDEGVNEIDPHVITAMSTNLLEKEDEKVIKTFSTFKLYRDMVKVTTEFER